MAIVGVSRETKVKLLSAAENGEGIELWLFQFICTDQEFQSVLFKKAEECENWKFLECLSQYREEQRNKQAAAIANQRKTQQDAKRQAAKQNRKTVAKQSAAKKKRALLIQEYRPLDPTTLPVNEVIRVPSSEYTNCPRCGLRLRAPVVRDHLELACKHRGKIDNWKISNGVPWSGPSYDDHWKS